MLILLPPSEGKAGPQRGRPVDLAALPFPELAATQQRVLSALAQASARPDAADVLRVSPRLGEEIALNTRLRTAPMSMT
ncbi:MAG TPA: hypothetical protein VHM65_03615 [Candidatus Lustribacter sp.]|nr:hypothetical protein [Candidatus Lustribacter sp.]